MAASCLTRLRGIVSNWPCLVRSGSGLPCSRILTYKVEMSLAKLVVVVRPAAVTPFAMLLKVNRAGWGWGLGGGGVGSGRESLRKVVTPRWVGFWLWAWRSGHADSSGVKTLSLCDCLPTLGVPPSLLPSFILSLSPSLPPFLLTQITLNWSFLKSS